MHLKCNTDLTRAVSAWTVVYEYVRRFMALQREKNAIVKKWKRNENMLHSTHTHTHKENIKSSNKRQMGWKTDENDCGTTSQRKMNVW